jgi:hypothetical protein
LVYPFTEGSFADFLFLFTGLFVIAMVLLDRKKSSYVASLLLAVGLFTFFIDHLISNAFLVAALVIVVIDYVKAPHVKNWEQQMVRFHERIERDEKPTLKDCLTNVYLWLWIAKRLSPFWAAAIYFVSFALLWITVLMFILDALLPAKYNLASIVMLSLPAVVVVLVISGANAFSLYRVAMGRQKTRSIAGRQYPLRP